MDQNPYQPPHESAAPARRTVNDNVVADLTRAAIPMMVCGVLGALGSLYNTASGILRNPLNPIFAPDADPQLASMVFWSSVFMLLQSVLTIAGAAAMLTRRRRWLALTGAWALTVPWCGCYVIPAIVGIWSIVLLSRQSAREEFAT